MFTARKKIVKEKGQQPDEFEESVAQVRRQRTDACSRLARSGLRRGGLSANWQS